MALEFPDLAAEGDVEMYLAEYAFALAVPEAVHGAVADVDGVAGAMLLSQPSSQRFNSADPADRLGGTAVITALPSMWFLSAISAA